MGIRSLVLTFGQQALSPTQSSLSPTESKNKQESQINTSLSFQKAVREKVECEASNREARQGNNILCLPQGCTTNPEVLEEEYKSP